MIKMRTVLSGFLIMLVLLLSACQSTQQSTPVAQSFKLNEGTDITITPPKGFVLAQEFLGFENTEQRAQIEVSELPLPLSLVNVTFSKEQLTTLKLTLESKQKVPYGNGEAWLFTLRQAINGLYYKKLWLLTGDEISTVRAVASYPESLENQLAAPMKQALLRSSYAPSMSERALLGLPFSFDTVDYFTISKRATNSVVLYGQNDELITLSHGGLKKEKVEHKVLSDLFLKHSKALTDCKERSYTAISVDSIPATQITTHCLYKGAPRSINQVIVTNPGKFLLIQAVDNQQSSSEFEAKLKQFVASIRLQKQN
ncbi:hypothetical protein V1358_08035 [Pseudoalteromonas sp. YIC-656]|uniref:hypothetical protein n=1 Tax=Pseudoalteromonas pernae TaxID=3118054 RepID=UPI003242415F